MTDAEDWIHVPYEMIADATLLALLEEACTRDGTELTDASLKVEELRQGLRRGHLELRYFPESNQCALMWSRPLT